MKILRPMIVNILNYEKCILVLMEKAQMSHPFSCTLDVFHVLMCINDML